MDIKKKLGAWLGLSALVLALLSILSTNNTAPIIDTTRKLVPTRYSNVVVLDQEKNIDIGYYVITVREEGGKVDKLLSKITLEDKKNTIQRLTIQRIRGKWIVIKAEAYGSGSK